MDFKENLADGHPYGDLTDWIDAVSRETGLGGLSDAYTSMLRGINSRGLGNPINKNLDNSGIVFFVRPDLNLSYDNIAMSRTLVALGAEDNPKPTLQRAIRAMLDPRGSLERGVTSPLFDHRQPFIPLLTNNLLSLNGWPDRAPGVYTSAEGVAKEQMAKIDGHWGIVGQFDLSASFRSTAGNPIMAMISAWLETAVLCHNNTMTPYQDNIVNRRLDYTTRIYHFTLDPGRQYIQQWAATGGSFPSTDPIGQMFNFSGGETMIQSADQVPINFTCIGADYNDTITLYEFNKVVGMFNEDLRVRSYRTDGTIEFVNPGRYIKIPKDLAVRTNYYGIPLIHPLTNELMWFISVDDLHKVGLDTA